MTEPLSTSDLAASTPRTDRDPEPTPAADEGDAALTATPPTSDKEISYQALDLDGQGEMNEPLLPADQTERFTSRWQEIQGGFVDQPRQSVEQADALVADLMQRLAASFSNEREQLEGQWDRDGDVSTEDLRIALTRYRSFFDRLLQA
jgi:hypothetical protein